MKKPPPYLLSTPFIAFLFFHASSLAQCGTCTLTQANLTGAPSAYTIPAGQTLCITSNYCMGAAATWPATCANNNVSQLTINGTLKICPGVTFSYSGTVVGAGTIDIMSNGRVNFNGSYDCSLGLKMRAVDPTITTGTSTSTSFSTCNMASCEPHFSNGYAPFGVVATGLGYTANGSCSIKGYPNDFLLLPTSISSWKAAWQGNNIVLEWNSVNDNNQSFTVEYAADGQQWHAASGIIETRSDSQEQDYSYTATGPFAENNFFRLKVSDNSGSYSYTNTLEITGPNQLAAGIALSPNPVQASFTLHNKGRVAICGLRLADMSGQTILQLPANATQYAIGKLAPGSYLLLVALADGSSTVKKLTKL